MRERAFHTVSQIFPLMQGKEFDELVRDIERHGLRDPIWVHHNGEVIDGRNRYRACWELGIEPEARVFDGPDSALVPFIVSVNLHRRHLDESQRAMMAGRIEEFEHGGPRHSEFQDANWHLNRADAAALLNVGARTVARARKVLDSGAPELQREVDEGRASVSVAADIATLPQAEQKEIVARGEKEILAKAKEIRAGKLRARIEARKAQFAAVTQEGCTVDDLQTLAAQGKRFGVIYADPPSEFRTYGAAGSGRSPEAHYPTMPLAAICALPVARLAADDSTLFLWGVWPRLPDVLSIIAAWGFAYKTAAFVWVKQGRSGDGLFTGMGYWTRANTEFCLLATKGHPQRLVMDVSEVILAPVMEHSEKPEETRRRIQHLLCGPYLELFARHRAPGWTAWGNEIPRAALSGAAA